MKKVKALIMAIILFVISVVVIIINAKTYTFNIPRWDNISNINELIIELDDDIAKCVSKSLEDDFIKVKIESVSKGNAYINMKDKNGNYHYTNTVYVHDLGIITISEYMGECNGSIVIPISIALWLAYVLYLLILSYKQSVKENMYQYKNIAYLGVIIFCSFAMISQLFALTHYQGFINTIEGIIHMYFLEMILFPIAIVVSILVIISNIVLIRKEGFRLTNILGLLLGTLLCFATMLPDILYQALNNATWIDIHNQNGIGVYLYNLVEAIICISISYIECVLIGTIIMGIKSAKHIPKFDKDFIIILGCQIKKDGSLTNLLKARVDRAIEFAKMQKEKTGKDIVFVPSGGKGSDEVIAEGQAMKNYLLEQGIKEEFVLVDDKSKNTFENIKFSHELIKERQENAKVAFSTTNYHVFRAGSIATEQNLLIEGIGAKTKSYFWINAFIREFIATIFSEKKKHIAMVSGIILLAIAMIAITYFNNNI